MIYFITPALLKQGRAWAAVERAYADVAQCHATYQTTRFQRVELPLLFVDPDHRVLTRSIWQPVIESARSFRFTRQPRETKVAWATRQINEFLQQEELWAEDARKRLRADHRARDHFSESDGLLSRIFASELPPLRT